MTDLTKRILDLPMPSNDVNAATIRDYLKALLSTLWYEDESFSGKRPFGNSGWKNDVYVALVTASVVNGELDDDGFLEWCDAIAADDLIQQAISGLT